jgi:hypothetical protein
VPRKRVKAEDIEDATAALEGAEQSIAKAKEILPDPNTEVSPEEDKGIVQTIHDARSDIESALSALGGKPCGGGKPC